MSKWINWSSEVYLLNVANLIRRFLYIYTLNRKTKSIIADQDDQIILYTIVYRGIICFPLWEDSNDIIFIKLYIYILQRFIRLKLCSDGEIWFIHVKILERDARALGRLLTTGRIRSTKEAVSMFKTSAKIFFDSHLFRIIEWLLQSSDFNPNENFKIQRNVHQYFFENWNRLFI